MLKYFKEHIIVRYIRYLRTWRAHRETIKQLNSLDNETLQDIGLSRGDISHLIWLEKDKMKTGKRNDT
jgi:uncharacterized protein YjiS (DUF1127 family)